MAYTQYHWMWLLDNILVSLFVLLNPVNEKAFDEIIYRNFEIDIFSVWNVVVCISETEPFKIPVRHSLWHIVEELLSLVKKQPQLVIDTYACIQSHTSRFFQRGRIINEISRITLAENGSFSPFVSFELHMNYKFSGEAFPNNERTVKVFQCIRNHRVYITYQLIWYASNISFLKLLHMALGF